MLSVFHLLSNCKRIMRHGGAAILENVTSEKVPKKKVVTFQQSAPSCKSR